MVTGTLPSTHRAPAREARAVWTIRSYALKTTALLSDDFHEAVELPIGDGLAELTLFPLAR